MADGAWQGPWVSIEVVVDADVDQQRTVGQADQTRELGRGEHCGRRHDASAPFWGDVDAILGPKPHGAIAKSP